MSSSPNKEDLPRLANPLQKELVQEHHLRPTETAEKVILPTAEDVDKEKLERSLMSEIASGVKLDHVVTQEKNKLPTAEEIAAEKK